jgi:hypothetical protein
MAQQPRRLRLQCPFCGGSRFDDGRDVFAGLAPVVYCRRPSRGDERHPDGEFSLPLKGAVCLDCGFVAMMLDWKQLHSPIRRAADAAALAAGAGAETPPPPGSVDAEAAEALKRMSHEEDRIGDEGHSAPA